MKGLYSLGLYEKAMPGGMAFEDMLRSTAQAGFDRLEISIDESDERLARLDWTGEQRAAVRNASWRAQVPIETMCLSGHRRFPLGSRDAAVRRRARDIMQKALGLSADLGVRIIQLAGYDVYYEEGDSYTRQQFLEGLQHCAEMAAAAGILLGFETMETPFMDTVAKAMEYVRAISSPYLGVYPDIGNLKNAALLHGHNLCEDIAAGAGHIFAAHLKETVPGVYRNRTFGDGHTEYIPCIRALYAQGVRMFTGEFWHLGQEDYMHTLRAANAFLREKIETAAAG